MLTSHKTGTEKEQGGGKEVAKWLQGVGSLFKTEIKTFRTKALIKINLLMTNDYSPIS